MKKWTAMLLCLCMLFSLVACQVPGENTESGSDSESIIESVTESDTATESETGTEGSETEGSETETETEVEDTRIDCVSIDGGKTGTVELIWSSVDANGNLIRGDRSATGKSGMVSSANVYASQAGLEVLKAGGNAIDAAIAVSYALGVVEPQSSGIGGGGFMLIRTADGENAFIDFREVAPAAQDAYTWLDENGAVKNNGKANQLGGLAVAVPGTVAGMEKAFELYSSGLFTRKALMTPAIELAERGFYVGRFQYNQTAEKLANIKQFEAISGYYLKEDGSLYKTGELFSNPDLGKTLRLIAEGGADAFYKGEIAEAMLAEIQRLGGVMTQSDLDNYKANLREPVTGTYRGYEIISCPPPSSGGTHVIEILNILENFDLGSMGVNSAQSIHLWSETLKAVYADRGAYMADTDFVPTVPLSGLTSKEYAKTIADRITEVSQSWLHGDPMPYVHDSTTSFSVADQWGNIVTVTQTLECSFGSCVAVPGYGFVLNDEMHDFSTNPASLNCVQGEKHPLSSMSPTIVLNADKTPFMTLGTPAGLRIYTTVAQVISHVIDHGMDLQTAIDTARIYDRGDKVGIEYETSGNYVITAETIAELEAMGHTMTSKGNWKIYFGGVQGVMYMEDGSLFGAADPRRDGKALGY